eukprot:1903418-Pyramimonas_sp.AAC.1
MGTFSSPEEETGVVLPCLVVDRACSFLCAPTCCGRRARLRLTLRPAWPPELAREKERWTNT